MESKKIAQFMKLAGQSRAESPTIAPLELRKLGAQLLLSEVLEYVIKGLGLTPVINGVEITEPEKVTYREGPNEPSLVELIDGLADTAYTMYWNSEAFALPLEEAFELVCNNNLTKFVKLEKWADGERDLTKSEWDCGLGVIWPAEVERVHVLKVDNDFYAVGKDSRGKVRKPSTYHSVNLEFLLPKTGTTFS